MREHHPVIAGINTGHDGGAAIITADRIVAIGEERLNRTRYSPGWQAALLYCLRALDIRLSDIDAVGVSGIGHVAPAPTHTGLIHLGLDRAQIHPVDHHLAHAYSAFCLSPFDTATVLVVDGAGNNGDTETWYYATADTIQRVGGNDPGRLRAGGIGAAYEAFTNWLGWHEQEAGKTMALAALGDPHAFTSPLFELRHGQVHGILRRTHADGIAELAQRTGCDFGPPDSRGEDPRGINAAAYVQHQTEQIMCALAQAAIAQTGQADLCLAGGVALNCVANEMVRRHPSVNRLFVPPPASDRGQALGAALLAWHRIVGELPKRTLAADSFGRHYSTAEVEQALKRNPQSGLVERQRTPYTWRKESDIAATAAQMIADGKLVAWFAGGSELGPRALGQRSILADPRTVRSRDTLNQRIKHREPFRPFAPAVLAEQASTWFALEVASPYMLLAPMVRPERAAEIAGVVHADGSARVQTVDTEITPGLADVLRHFQRITGVPVLLNTSFNDCEPIVETPAHALATFQATDLDALCIEGHLVEKTSERLSP